MPMTPAFADLVTWTFNDAFLNGQQVFDLPGVVGDFVYNVDTNQITSFNISVGSSYFLGTAFSFNQANSVATAITTINVYPDQTISGTRIDFTQNNPGNVLSPPGPLFAHLVVETNPALDPPLTDNGVVPIGHIYEYTNAFSGESNDDSLALHGTLVGTTPEPTFFAIVGAGLGLLAIAHRRRRPQNH